MRAFCHKFILLILVSLSSFYAEPQNGSEYLSPTSIFKRVSLNEVDFIVKKIRAYPKSLQMMLVYSHLNPFSFPEELKSETQAGKYKIYAALSKNFLKISYMRFREKWGEAIEEMAATFLFSFPSEEEFSTKSYNKKELGLIELRHHTDPTQNRFLKSACNKFNALQFFNEMKIAETLSKKLKEQHLEEEATRLTGIYNIEGLYFSYFENKYWLIQSNRLIEGENIESYLKNNGPQSIFMTLNIIEQLLHTLILFKKVELIHGDFSDSNVMIEKNAQVKTIDFGIAEFTHSKNKYEDNSSIFGTIPFLSPEAIRYNKKTYQDELWSIGVLFYELLKGGLPFTISVLGYTRIPSEKLFRKVVSKNQPVLELAGYKEDPLGYATAQVINKMLSLTPMEQYQTAEEVLAAISEIEEKCFAVSL